MHLHADFTKRATAHGASLDWIPSPMKGVDRRMLERVGYEVARATSIVRYAAGSAFSPHIHTGGEEFIVLEGVFQDEHGDYPAGSYVRNPPTSRHTPRSDAGCTILVKLWQFDPDDRTPVVLDLKALAIEAEAEQGGLRSALLFQNDFETVRLEQWGEEEQVALGAIGGSEYFVLDGGFNWDGEKFSKYSWARLPQDDTAIVTAGETGAKVWVKTGHLPYAKPPAVSG